MSKGVRLLEYLRRLGWPDETEHYFSGPPSDPDQYLSWKADYDVHQASLAARQKAAWQTLCDRAGKAEIEIWAYRQPPSPDAIRHPRTQRGSFKRIPPQEFLADIEFGAAHPWYLYHRAPDGGTDPFNAPWHDPVVLQPLDRRGRPPGRTLESADAPILDLMATMIERHEATGPYNAVNNLWKMKPELFGQGTLETHRRRLTERYKKRPT